MFNHMLNDMIKTNQPCISTNIIHIPAVLTLLIKSMNYFKQAVRD